MAIDIDMGPVGPQNPLFGISHANIARRLDRSNWNTKAVVRVGPSGALYIYIGRGQRGDSKTYRYYVEVHAADPETGRRYRLNFRRLGDALAFVNREDGGILATETRAAQPSEYPAPKSAQWYFTSRVGFPG